MEAKSPWHTCLHAHAYPVLFWKYPCLIHLVNFWNNLLLQRHWAVRRLLRRELATLEAGNLVVDAGCGHGQHLFAARRWFPALRFCGFDKNENNVAFCRHFDKEKQVGVYHLALEHLHLDGQAGFLLCIGTLQYIEDDQRVLKNFFTTLIDKGKLLLYVPVNGKTILPFYRHFFKKWNNYEKQQQRCRIYTPEEILTKLKGAGFSIKQQRFTYGSIGIVAHECYSLVLMGMGNGGRWAWLCLPILAAILPLILIAKSIDFILPKRTGNGLLLLAEKVT